MTKRLDKDRVILTLLAFGFLLTALEVNDLHREVLRERWQGYIPIVFSVCALLAACLALSRSVSARALAGVVFLIGIPVGLFGFFQHTEGDITKVMRLVAVQTLEARADGGEEGEAGGGGGEKEAKAPPLAPLSVAGLASVGAAVVLLPRK